MREKMLDLMKNEGLKPSQLAEMLEINPAGISHILAGRNKPGFDLLQKILRRFPRINPDWLMLDSAQMYRSQEVAASSANTSTSSIDSLTGNRFGTSATGSNSAGASSATPGGNLFNSNGSLPFHGADAAHLAGSARNSHNPSASEAWGAAATLAATGKSATVKRVVILFDDETFESYCPANIRHL